MTEQLIKALAQMLADNLGNRLTKELANGILVGLDQVAKAIAPPPTPPEPPHVDTE